VTLPPYFFIASRSLSMPLAFSPEPPARARPRIEWPVDLPGVKGSPRCYSTNNFPAQNSKRSMSWIFRGEPIPVELVFSSLVMTPKPAGSEISDAGLP
jgi:hypothetical protein